MMRGLARIRVRTRLLVRGLARFRERTGAEGREGQERYSGGWGRAVGTVKGAILEGQNTKSIRVSRT